MFRKGIFDQRKNNRLEDYYRILGTTAKAGPEKIKERYFEKLRAFPPETHPEEFQQIRKAYETLKNPDERRKYDILRKFGPKIEKEMNNAMIQVITGNDKAAHKTLSKIIEMDPDNIQGYLIKAELYLEQNNLADFEIYFQKAIDKLKTEEGADLAFLKIALLAEHGYMEAAQKEIVCSKERYPASATQFDQISIRVYRGLRDYENLWQVTSKLVPPIKESQPDHIYLMIDWLIAGLELEKKKEISHIISRMKKLLRLIEDQEERDYLTSVFVDEYCGYHDVGRFEDAMAFIELALFIDKNDKELQALKKELVPLVALDATIRRLDCDCYLIPYLKVVALKHFYESFDIEPEEGFSADYYQTIAEYKDCNEEIAWGIMQIKKRYPAVYKAFQSDWEALFAEHTAGLNREAKRRLR
ncbi:DnaJ domain-containing protein [Acetobacterium wieringae]|uniref:DnaJ domain-containing protein n=1 Tax=Acetobacterium wieringae TaxID=52694 RepID=A0ABY6HJW2_9FIRM|nr:DnaJ domain-containing protein [Acetobacterium wieringae]UYO63838.1 DnaJ domain-containing protein [Acetobacterium wieringae]VUZ27266.1 Chaperone protein DnaJ [Acetobacterium wieringae]